MAGNLQRFGYEKTARTETLQDIIQEMGEPEPEQPEQVPASTFNFVSLIKHQYAQGAVTVIHPAYSIPPFPIDPRSPGLSP